MFTRCALALLLAVLSVGALAAPHRATSPTIVASQSFLNQTAFLPLTTVFTPTVTGMYRISVYGECQPNTSCLNGSTVINLVYTDASGIPQLLGLSTASSGDFVIHPASGTSVQVQAGGANPTYNVYVVVEQLF